MRVRLLVSMIGAAALLATGVFAGTSGPPGTPFSSGFPATFSIGENSNEPPPGALFEVTRFLLPGPVHLGDVVLHEVINGQPTNLISDLVRFGIDTNGNFNNQVVTMWSDADETNGLNLALLPGPALGFAGAPVILVESNDPTVYIVPNPFGGTMTYLISSDVESVPEPSALLLTGLGLLGIRMCCKRRRA